MPHPSLRVLHPAKAAAALDALWSPGILARVNEVHLKVARLHGDFEWHHHAESDEAFYVLEGRLRIDLRDGAVELGPGELFVVPRGVEHKPFAAEECRVLLVEPAGTVNTGEHHSGRTAEARWVE